MRDIEAVLFDLDGTIYAGEQLIAGADDVVNSLALKNVNVAFVTNNSTKTREQIKKKLGDMGISSELKDIYTSASITARYLQKNEMNSVYAIGTDSFKLELNNFGIEVVEDDSCNCVVIGMINNIQEYDLSVVSTIANRPDSILIACNRDMSYPNGEGSVGTGCGQVVNYVEDFLGRSVDMNIGKPELTMLHAFCKDNKIAENRIMVVGDSYTSDVQMALAGVCLPVLLTEESLQYDDCITIGHISDVIELFELPDIINNLVHIQDADELISTILKPYQALLDSMNQVYLFGAQQLGEKLFDQCTNAGIEVLGFIDNDPKKHGQILKGKPIISLQDCDQQQSIIIASTTYMGEIQQQLLDAKFTSSIPFTILNLWDEVSFISEPVFKGMHRDIIENKLKYISLYLLLRDKGSKETLCKLLDCRLTFNFHSQFTEFGLHYFDENILQLHEDEVFVDGGGYSGDTSQVFVEKASSYKEIHIFEPDEYLLQKAKQRLSSYPNIFLHQQGLYSHKSTLFFKRTGGLDGTIDESGDYSIQVTSIDEEIDIPVTFIKLDIEGAEEAALKGAQIQLQKHEPKLAIACYHKANDLWNLTRLVLELNPNYRVYLRHYSKSALETVLYAIKN